MQRGIGIGTFIWGEEVNSEASFGDIAGDATLMDVWNGSECFVHSSEYVEHRRYLVADGY